MAKKFPVFDTTKAKVINVDPPNIAHIDRRVILLWVNETLQTEFKRIDQLGTGAAYCHLWEKVFPGTLKLKDIKFSTQSEVDFIKNFDILKRAFRKYGVVKHVPVNKLVKGYFLDNFEFLCWFKAFFDINYKGDVVYKAVTARVKGANMNRVQGLERPYSLFAADSDDIPSFIFTKHF